MIDDKKINTRSFPEVLQGRNFFPGPNSKFSHRKNKIIISSTCDFYHSKQRNALFSSRRPLQLYDIWNAV